MSKKIERYTSKKDSHPELLNLFFHSSLWSKKFEVAENSNWHSIRVYDFDFKKEYIQMRHETHKTPVQSGKKYFEVKLIYNSGSDSEKLESIRQTLTERLGMKPV